MNLPEPEPVMDGCPVVWVSPSGTHVCMHPIVGHPMRHEPYIGSPSFMAVGYEDMTPWRVYYVPRRYTGTPTSSAPPRAATAPLAPSEAPEVPVGPLGEFAAAQDALAAALRQTWEPHAITLVERMTYYLDRTRHAWTVGLDGPWWERFIIRCLYTVGVLHSPTWFGQSGRKRKRGN